MPKNYIDSKIGFITFFLQIKAYKCKKLICLIEINTYYKNYERQKKP
jgi:hypothetical protein